MLFDGGEPRSHPLVRFIDRATQISSDQIEHFIAAARRGHQALDADALQRRLDITYISLVTTAGAVAGGVAAAPGVWLPGGVAASIAEAASFTTLTMTYVLATASIRGVDVGDLERRRALLLTALLGSAGPELIERIASRTGRHWGRIIAGGVPIEVIREINRVMGHRLVTRYGTKQGILVLGRLVPAGVGALIGGLGNACMARATVAVVRRAFAEPGD